MDQYTTKQGNAAMNAHLKKVITRIQDQICEIEQALGYDSENPERVYELERQLEGLLFELESAKRAANIQ